MSGRISSATEKALSMIGKKGKDGAKITAYKAAKLNKIALSTIYRALKRQK